MCIYVASFMRHAQSCLLYITDDVPTAQASDDDVTGSVPIDVPGDVVGEVPGEVGDDATEVDEEDADSDDYTSDGQSTVSFLTMLVVR